MLLVNALLLLAFSTSHSNSLLLDQLQSRKHVDVRDGTIWAFNCGARAPIIAAPFINHVSQERDFAGSPGADLVSHTAQIKLVQLPACPHGRTGRGFRVHRSRQHGHRSATFLCQALTVFVIYPLCALVARECSPNNRPFTDESIA